MIAKGKEVGGRMESEVGVSRCKPLYMEGINKILLYNTENYIQYPEISYNDKVKEYMYVCIYN